MRCELLLLLRGLQPESLTFRFRLRQILVLGLNLVPAAVGGRARVTMFSPIRVLAKVRMWLKISCLYLISNF